MARSENEKRKSIASPLFLRCLSKGQTGPHHPQKVRRKCLFSRYGHEEPRHRSKFFKDFRGACNLIGRPRAARQHLENSNALAQDDPSTHAVFIAGQDQARFLSGGVSPAG